MLTLHKNESLDDSGHPQWTVVDDSGMACGLVYVGLVTGRLMFVDDNVGFEAAELRQIADKLDELNKEKRP